MVWLKITNILCLTFLLNYSAESAKILASVFSPSYSHQIAFRPLWKELLKRGHHITLLTTDPMKDPSLKNLTEIDLSYSYKLMDKHNASTIVTQQGKSIKQLLDDYILALSEIADWQLSNHEVRTLIQNRSEYFDLFIAEVMFPTHMGFVDRFKVPFIGITSLDAPVKIHELVGNPTNPAIYPDYVLPVDTPMTFFQRVKSVLFYIAFQLYGRFCIIPREDITMKKHFGENIRSIIEIQRDMDMLFTYVNPAFHTVRALGPNTIRFGGGNPIGESQEPLTKELKEFLDDAGNGAIYFSLGTNVKSNALDDRLRTVFLNTLAKLPYKILWKYEEDNLPGKPDNVMIVKWVPQASVMGHPNLKLFITQCGLQSLEESVHNHIPMIGIPFFGDQSVNAKIIVRKGIGKTLDRKTVTEDEFRNAILDVINNDTYKNNVKELDELSKDLEMTGLEKAVWWTEYVIRHKGAKHFKNPAKDIPLYQYLMLDVIAFVLAVIFIISYLCIRLSKFIIKFTLNRIFLSKKKKD